MKVFSKRWWIPCLAAFGVAAASAQADPAASADAILDSSRQVLRAIDQDDADAMWQGAAPFIKARMSQQEFVDGARAARRTVGAVKSRDWSGIVRIRVAEGSASPPPGLYANVDFATLLADGRTVYEKLSLRYEAGGWRWTGYIPRQQQ